MAALVLKYGNQLTQVTSLKVMRTSVTSPHRLQNQKLIVIVFQCLGQVGVVKQDAVVGLKRVAQ